MSLILRPTELSYSPSLTVAQLSIWQVAVAGWKWPPGNGNGQAFPVGLCHLASWHRKEHFSHPGRGLAPSAPGRVWWRHWVPWSEGSLLGGAVLVIHGELPGQTAGTLPNWGSFVGMSSSILCSHHCPSLQRVCPVGITQPSRVTLCLVPAGLSVISVVFYAKLLSLCAVFC